MTSRCLDLQTSCTFINYKFSPLIHNFNTPNLDFCTEMMNKCCELSHSGAVSQANTSVCTWSRQHYYLFSYSSVICSCKKHSQTAYHTMPTCFGRSAVFLPPNLPHVPYISPVSTAIKPNFQLYLLSPKCHKRYVR